MIMRDLIHQIDFGTIVHRIRAIMRKFHECVEIALDKAGIAAKNSDNALILCSATALTDEGVSLHMCRAQPLICNTILYHLR